MKKLIAILVIMIVLVGAVFAETKNTDTAKTAEGTAKIKVTANIAETAPAFELKIASATSIIGEQSDAVSNPVTVKDAALALASTNKLTGANETEPADVTVKFAINQIANANLKASYKITVSATRLELKQYSNGEAAPASADLNGNEYFAIEDDTPEVSASNTVVVGGVNAVTFDDTDANELHIQYTGRAQVAATVAEPVELGTFDVTWQKNTKAVAGDYEATVQIVVESV